MIAFIKARRERKAAELIERILKKDQYPPGLSKGARNEMRKLKATFFNNSAIALTVGGYLVPTSILLPKLLVMAKQQIGDGHYWDPVPLDVMLSVSGGTICVLLGLRYRRKAQMMLIGMED